MIALELPVKVALVLKMTPVKPELTSNINILNMEEKKSRIYAFSYMIWNTVSIHNWQFASSSMFPINLPYTNWISKSFWKSSTNPSTAIHGYRSLCWEQLDLYDSPTGKTSWLAGDLRQRASDKCVRYRPSRLNNVSSDFNQLPFCL